MAIVGGLTRAVSIGALALGGLLGALLPVRASFWLTGAASVLVALALAAYVLPRFGREDTGAGAAAAPGSGGQQEAVADQVPHFGQQAGAELGAVKPLVAAQQGLEGADDLPDGQVAVAR